MEHHQPGHRRARPVRAAAGRPARAGRRAAARGSRDEERSSWELGTVTRGRSADHAPTRCVRQGRHVGRGPRRGRRRCCRSCSTSATSFLMSQICIYAVIALSLTVLTGWAGQVSLGQFGLVAVGAIVAAHLGTSVPLVLLLPFAGVVTAVVAVLVGLPALRVRGLYLAVSTLGFALLHADDGAGHPVLDRCPLVHTTRCAPACPTRSRRCSRAPTLFGLVLSLERAFAWFSLAVLVVVGPDGQGVARPRRRPPPGRGARQRDGGRRPPASRSCAPSSWPSRCRASWPATPGCASPSPTERISTEHLRPDGLDPGHLDGRDRRARLDPRRRARRRSTWSGCRPSSAPPRPSSSSPAASGSWPSSSTCPAAWPSCCSRFGDLVDRWASCAPGRGTGRPADPDRRRPRPRHRRPSSSPRRGRARGGRRVSRHGRGAGCGPARLEVRGRRRRRSAGCTPSTACR